MNERIAVTLDFTACKYIPELYKEIRTKMEWDDDFGENLSALWDILTGMPYKGDDFTIIRRSDLKIFPMGKMTSSPNMWTNCVQSSNAHRIGMGILRQPFVILTLRKIIYQII